MFQSNSRTEFVDGIKFYEQDVLFDNFSYNGDLQIILEVDYITPGIGIALMTNEGLPISEQKEVYLFRSGYREAGVHYRLGDVLKKLSAVSTTLMPPHENIKLTFTKTGRKVTLAAEGYDALIEYTLPVSIDKYSIGIYSNAGNTVRSMSVASSIPEGWNVNMRNTDGGYIKFAKDGFQIEGCTNHAEVEQEGITLPAGTNYVRFTTEAVDGVNDIECFVLASGDERLTDAEKNLLKDGMVKLTDPTLVNIKFKGKQGAVKNVFITDSYADNYVSTKDAEVLINGSYIEAALSGLTEIRWTGTVSSIPLTVSANDESTGVFIIGSDTVSWSDAGIIMNQEYSYSFDIEALTLTVTKDLKAIKTIGFTQQADSVTIFKNVDAVISEFTVVKTNGQVISMIAEQTSKRYVPFGITSPILVVDDESNPLDLSSSYRYTVTNGFIKYLFTNWERELFEPSTHLRTEKRIASVLGSIKVYGVPKTATVNADRILQIPQEGMDTIDMFSAQYDIIPESSLYYVDKFIGDIYLENVDKYQLIVVDYLKRDSYCINALTDSQMYEVDISAEADSVSLIYDHSTSGTVSQSNNYKVTGVYPDDKNYIVLRREGF